MVISGHPGWLGKNFFGQNVTWACGISMQKIFFEKSYFLKKFEKSGGEKMVITDHPWWLGKIFFGQKSYLGLRN